MIHHDKKLRAVKKIKTNVHNFCVAGLPMSS